MENKEKKEKKQIPILNWGTRLLMILANISNIWCIILYQQDTPSNLTSLLGPLSLVLALVCGLFTIGRLIGWDSEEASIVGSHYETTIDFSSKTATTKEVDDYAGGKSRIETFLKVLLLSGVFLPFGIFIAIFLEPLIVLINKITSSSFWNTKVGKVLGIILAIIGFWLALMMIVVVFWCFVSVSCGDMIYR